MQFVLKRGCSEYRIEPDPRAANDRYFGSINGVVVTTGGAPEEVLATLIRSSSGPGPIGEQVDIDAFGQVRHRGRADRE